MTRSTQLSELSNAIRRNAPRTPGIYIFYGVDDTVIYIGKSVNLRNRMLSYFNQHLAATDRRIGRMTSGIRDFDYCTTETDLQAQLLEDELIKRLRPENNIRQLEYEENCYLLLSDDPYPTLRMIKRPDREWNGTIFGPYRDRYFTVELLDVIYRCFRLRSCHEPHPGGNCMNYEIGICKGPCRGAVSKAEYRVIVDHVVEFLRGGDAHAISGLTRAMEAAASKRLYENASKLKSDLEFCRRFCERQRFIHGFLTGRLRLCETRAKRITHRFDKGRWVAGRIQVSAASYRIKAAIDGDSNSERDPRFVVDRANIVFNWINNNPSDCDYCFY